ncbi:MAG: hypothetical protein PQJ45_07010 [Sphaerochaetaceae bacterium]|nr:hypothetical protein [Sphaerochaetaceae bacterium]
MNNIILSYDQVLSKLNQSLTQNNLLLGNGFNLSLGVNTSYKNIFELMKKNNKEYSIMQSENLDIEEFIGKCKSNIREDNPIFNSFLTTFIHNKIKLDFMKAVTEIVSKEIKNIYEEKTKNYIYCLKILIIISLLIMILFYINY